MDDSVCERAQTELSVAHDEGRQIDLETASHVAGCESCQVFTNKLEALDVALAAGRSHRAPDIAPRVLEISSLQSRPWWSVAAIALVGLVAGAIIGGVGTRLQTSQAQDLDDLFHAASSAVRGLSADLIVVERGVHPDIPERVYVGTIGYAAPERLAIELVDTTLYPDGNWIPNDVSFTLADGDMVVVAGRSCPVPGIPECLLDPTTNAVRDLPPFDRGILVPLEIVGPGRSLTWPSGVDVLGHQDLAGRATIQVQSTVAAVDLIGALVDHGAWRDYHPTDTVVLWLDEATLVPIRLEVFPAASDERQLWQLRRGYSDGADDGRPILIVEFSNLVTHPPAIEVEVPTGAPTGGFVDASVTVPVPDLPAGFEPHRTGRRPIGEGEVQVATWSDGRSWLMVETTSDWSDDRLFGMSQPFVRAIDLGAGSIGYLAPSGDRVALHTTDGEIVVSGSVPVDSLIEAAASLEKRGLPVPEDWLEAATVDIDGLAQGTLVPAAEGWSLSARKERDRTSILLTSGGSRSVLIVQEPGEALEPPAGPDVIEVPIRDATGRYDSATGTLEWVEDGLVIRVRSDTVGRDVLVEVAESMRRR